MARHSVHIEHKDYDPEGASGQLREALLEHVGRELSVADAATLSGLPLFNVEPGLLALSSEFPSRIRVNDEGELLFTFDRLDHPRSGSPLQQTLRRMASRLGAFFVPVVVFVTLVLSCPLLMTLGANNFAMMAVAGGLLGILGAPFFLTGFFTASAGFVWGTVMLLMVMPTVFFLMGLAMLALVVLEPEDGMWIIGLIFGIPMVYFGGKYAYQQLQELPSALRSQEKGTLVFWRQIAGFIFGPVPRLPDSLEDERRLTALIAERQGIVSRGDLMALMGWDEATADSELTRILVDYSGDIVVTDEGVILYRFTTLAASGIEASEDLDRSPAWERDTPPPQLFDCPQSVWIGLLILLVSGALGLLLHPDLAFFPDAADYRRLAGLYAGDIPLWVLEGAGGYIYALVLGIPLVRLPFWLYATRRHAQHQAWLAKLALEVEARGEEARAAKRARREGWDVIGEAV